MHLDAMHAFEIKHGYVKFSYNGINQLSQVRVFPQSFADAILSEI
jgi:hypothetical protein